MTKLFITLSLFISSFSLLQAQEGYLKFAQDTELQGQKFFKGEIYQLSNETKDKLPYFFTADSRVYNVGKNFEKLQSNPENKTAEKDTFIKSKDGGLIHIDVSSVSNGSDTIWFVNEKNERTPLVNKDVIDKTEEYAGKTFRLILPNTVTIYYTLEQLSKFSEPPPPENSDRDNDGVTDDKDFCPDESGIPENNGCPKSGLAWWYYVIILLAANAIGFGVWKYIKSRKKLNQNEVIFNGTSLSDWSKTYGGLDFLSSINPKGLIPTKSEWDKIKNKNEGQQKLNSLQGRKIIINRENSSQFGLGENTNYQKEKEKEKENLNTHQWDNPKETIIQPSNFSNNDNISQQLRQVENNIISAIKLSGSASNSSGELSKLRNDKTELENKLRVLEKEKGDSDMKQIQLQTEKSNLENNLQSANTERNQIQAEIKELKEKVIAVEFLKRYSESVFSFLKYCQQVSNDAYDFFNKISHQNPKQAFALGHLLMKFQSSVNSIPVGDWLRTVQDIKDSGATTNRQLTRSFAQIQNDSDKLKEFQRLLFSEVLIRYSSNILVLAEALKNLSRFQGSADFANEAQSTFAKHVSELISKAKSTGLELKHVTLFESWEKHIGLVEDNGGERSLAYKEISGLEKGTIAEIVSFGAKTSLGDDTKTIIILA